MLLGQLQEASLRVRFRGALIGRQVASMTTAPTHVVSAGQSPEASLARLCCEGDRPLYRRHQCGGWGCAGRSIFISHASADRDAPGELADTLRAAGFTVWWDDDLLSGQRYHDTLTNQLNTARAVVVLWTPDSVVSDWVYSKARRSNDQGKLVQVRTTAVEIDDLPAPFDAYHCARLEDTDRIVRAVSALVRPEPEADDPRNISEPATTHHSASMAEVAPAPRTGELPALLTPTVGTRKRDLRARRLPHGS